MSVQNEIDRIINAVESAHLKVAEKGGTTARPYLVGNLASAIESIPEYKDPALQQKTVTPTTSQQNVTPDSGYDGLSKVTVNAMPTATQATPSITVSTDGLITASATQGAGYVASGTKSATKQLTVQAAKTITPSTSSQTAVASGRYTTGTVTVKGDANLIAANIKKGVSIFGIVGTYEGGVTTDVDIDAIGYTDNTRWSTTDGTIRTGASGYTTINKIPFARASGQTMIVTLGGIAWTDSALPTQYAYILMYVDDSFVSGQNVPFKSFPKNYDDLGVSTVLNSDGTITITIVDSKNGRHYNGFKLCGVGSGANATIAYTIE